MKFEGRVTAKILSRDLLIVKRLLRLLRNNHCSKLVSAGLNLAKLREIKKIYHLEVPLKSLYLEAWSTFFSFLRSWGQHL